MDRKQLLKFCSYLIELKEKLKCAICLDIIKDVAELDCGHKFCSGCFEEYKSNTKNVNCPCCKIAIKRRSTLYKDEYSNRLGIFVSDVCNTLKGACDREVEEMIHKKSDTNAAGRSKTKKSRDILKNAETPSTSKSFKRFRRNPISKPCSQEDDFNMLIRKTNKMNVLTINKKGTKKVYDRRKEKRIESKYEILNFQDDKNKAAVLKWLTDTRNRFERLTQTQNHEDQDENVPFIDLTSVSQVGDQNEGLPQPPIEKLTRKNRARSLDIEVKKIGNSRKRFSDGSVFDSTENYNIEEANTEEENVVKKVEENILMHIIEDQFLDKLENELINEIELKSKGSLKENCSSSGWDRVGKIAKTIRNKEKVPKMLNITIQSSQSSILKKDKDKDSRISGTESVSKGIYSSIQIERMEDAQLRLKLPKQREKMLEILLQPVQHQTTTNEKSHHEAMNEIFSERQSSISKQDKENGSSTNKTKSVSKGMNYTLKVQIERMDVAKLRLELQKRHETMVKILLQPIGLETKTNKEKSHPKEINETLPDELSDNMKSNIVDSVEMQNGLQQAAKTYDLQEVENYIENNIEVLEKSNLDSTLDSELKEYEIDLSKGPTGNIPTVNEKIKILEVVVVRVNPNLENNPDTSEDPFILPTQKWNTSNESNSSSKTDDVLEGSANNSKAKTSMDFFLHSREWNKSKEFNPGKGSSNEFDAHMVDNPFLMLTQNNLQEDNDNMDMSIVDEEHVNNVGDIIKALEKGILKCFKLIDKNNTRSSKLVESMEHYLNQLKEFTINIPQIKECVDISTQTDLGTFDKQVQTFLDRSVKDTQTDIEMQEPKSVEVCNVEVQTSQYNCDELSNSKGPTGIISQNTQNAFESIIREPGLIEISTSEKHVSPNMLDVILADHQIPEEYLDEEKGNQEEQRRNIDSSAVLTQNTKDAFECILGDSQVIEESKSKEPVLMNLLIPENSISEEYIPRKSLAEVTKNQIFTCSLDNLKFETQDLGKNAGSKVASQKTEGAQNDKGDLVEDEKDMTLSKPTSVLVCSLNSNSSSSVRKKLVYFEGKQNNSKRSFTDSDFEEIIPPKRHCNRFIRDDLTIEFDVNTEISQSRGNKQLDSGSSAPENVDYESYLDDFMKRCGSGGDIATPKENGETSNNVALENKTSNVSNDEMDCDALVVKVNENIQNLAKNIDSKRSSANNSVKIEDPVFVGMKNLFDHLREKSQNSDEHFEEQDAPLCSEMLKPFEEKESNVHSELSDIIGVTESEHIEPIPKRAKRNNVGEVAEPKNGDKEKIPAHDNNLYVLDDSLDNAEFGDIKIDIDVNPLKEEKNNEEDLFSDDDIVETTPQKRKKPFQNRSIHTPDHLFEDIDFDFGALPPPTGFEDQPAQIENDHSTSDGQITVVEAETTLRDLGQSLTPDGLSQLRTDEKEILNRSNVKTDLFNTDKRIPPSLDVSKRKLIHSTPLSQTLNTRDTMGFSPIARDKSIIEQAVASKTPLTSISNTSTPRKTTIMTSTPNQKSIWNYVRSQSRTEKEGVKSKPCIACTRLSKEQTRSILSLTNKKLATYSSVFSPSVTHMIVAVDEKNCLKDYTMKFVAAVANGIWVLRFEWVLECLRVNSIVEEEPYEVLDDTGMPGPQASRLEGKEDLLLRGFKFYCAGPFYSADRKDIEEVIKMQGGRVLASLLELTEKDGNISLIIAESNTSQDFQIYENWLELYKTVTVEMEWLSRSIGRHKILNIRKYGWCSEDSLGDLGYPAHLIEAIESCSEQYSLMSDKY